MACCYKVLFKDQLLYIGSTVDFDRRVRTHKSNINNRNEEIYLYTYIREINIDANELIFEKIETECESKEELRRAEGLLIRQMKPICNARIEGRTKKEWYEDNTEQISEKQKERYNNNKEQILEKNKERYNTNRDIMTLNQRGYYNKNRDEINRKRREDRKNNPEKYREIDRRKREKRKLKNQQNI